MNTKLRKLRDSFRYALRGLRYCVRGERNLRIHLTAAVFVLWLSHFYGFSGAEYAVLFFAIGLVLVAELMNTAVEVLVDLHTQSYHALARVAKDVAAAGVLLSAGTSACVGVALLWRPAVLRAMAAAVLANPLHLLPPALILVLGGIFVFRPALPNKNNNQ